MLKVLLRDHHWQNYSTFCAEYDKAAHQIDPKLAGSYPSRAQLHRWLSGTLRGLPYADHCRVLEEMFPGWTAEQLFQPATTELALQAPAGPAVFAAPSTGLRPFIEQAFSRIRELPTLDAPTLPDQSILDQIVLATSIPQS